MGQCVCPYKRIGQGKHPKIFGISALKPVVGMAMLAIFSLKMEIVIIHIVFLGTAGGFGTQSFFRLRSAKLFPTPIRSCTQDTCVADVRVGLGAWNLAMPSLASINFTVPAWILTALLVVNGASRCWWLPRIEGPSLEEIVAVRGGPAAA